MCLHFKILICFLVGLATELATEITLIAKVTDVGCLITIKCPFIPGWKGWEQSTIKNELDPVNTNLFPWIFSDLKLVRLKPSTVGSP